MKKFLFLIFLFFLGYGVFLIFNYYLNPKKSFVFYYPKFAIVGFDSEKREIKINKNKAKNLEEILIREYLLGPISYKMRPGFPVEVDVKSIFIIYSVKSVDAIIDFNSEFLSYIDKIDEWTIRSFLETLKVNTRIKKVLFLCEGKRMKEKIGNYNLYNFIEIKK